MGGPTLLSDSAPLFGPIAMSSLMARFEGRKSGKGVGLKGKGPTSHNAEIIPVPHASPDLRPEIADYEVPSEVAAVEAAPPAVPAPKVPDVAHRQSPLPQSVFKQPLNQAMKLPPGVRTPEFETKRDLATAWAAYGRALTEVSNTRIAGEHLGTRGDTTDKASPDIVAKLTSIHSKTL